MNSTINISYYNFNFFPSNSSNIFKIDCLRYWGIFYYFFFVYCLAIIEDLVTDGRFYGVVFLFSNIFLSSLTLGAFGENSDLVMFEEVEWVIYDVDLTKEIYLN